MDGVAMTGSQDAVATRLCEGLRTADLTAAGLDQAARLRGVPTEDVDAVVLLDPIADGVAVEELQRLARAGVRLVLAAPCDALEALAAAASVRVMPEHQLVTVGFEHGGGVDVVALIAANEELRRANISLSKAWLGRSDSAAASIQNRFEGYRERLRAVEAEVRARDAQITELSERLAAAELRYQQERAARTAPRYRAVDAVRDRILAIPGFSLVMRALWRLAAPRT